MKLNILQGLLLISYLFATYKLLSIDTKPTRLNSLSGNA